MNAQRKLSLSPEDIVFWRGRRVLVTGHTGFKGGWLAVWLTRLGARLTGLSLPGDGSGIFELHREQLLSAGLQDLRGDIRERADLDAAIAAAQPEVVLHLAAQAIVLDSYREPETTWDTNVMGTLALLQALARRLRSASGAATASFVAVTSDKCYENREWPWGYRENDPLGGKDPYSASKAACEILVASWRHSFARSADLRIASARAGNVIGGGDSSPHRIVPDLMRAFAAGQAAQIRNPASTRPYQHVLEPLSGYLRLARRLHEDGSGFEQAFNFGPLPDGEITTRTLAEQAARLWGAQAHLAFAPQGDRPHEAGTLMLDSSLARRQLGWTPTWNAAEAIAAAVAWHRALHVQGADAARAETLRQIAGFETGAGFVTDP